MKIFVKVKPNSIEDKIEKIDDLNYLVFVKERPVENKANLSLIKILAKYFGVSSKNVSIKNPTSRKKIIELLD